MTRAAKASEGLVEVGCFLIIFKWCRSFFTWLWILEDSGVEALCPQDKHEDEIAREQLAPTSAAEQHHDFTSSLNKQSAPGSSSKSSATGREGQCDAMPSAAVDHWHTGRRGVADEVRQGRKESQRVEDAATTQEARFRSPSPRFIPLDEACGCLRFERMSLPRGLSCTHFSFACQEAICSWCCRCCPSCNCHAATHRCRHSPRRIATLGPFVARIDEVTTFHLSPGKDAIGSPRSSAR